MRRKLAAGNWKMNGMRTSLTEASAIAASAPDVTNIDVLFCPPATLVAEMSKTLADSPIHVGGQDCHTAESGAHTGDISAPMLADAGATHVILGHSERRADHGESDALVAEKTSAAWAAGLCAIVCLGETEAQRDGGQTLNVIGGQLAASVPNGASGERLVVAYEPVWAIGTGKVPTLDQIAEVHDFLRAQISQRFGEPMAQSIRLLYGGSVKGANAADIFAVSNVDGALVGGASLKSADFAPIVTALAAAP